MLSLDCSCFLFPPPSPVGRRTYAMYEVGKSPLCSQRRHAIGALNTNGRCAKWRWTFHLIKTWLPDNLWVQFNFRLFCSVVVVSLTCFFFVCLFVFLSDEVAAYELKQKEAEAKKERLWVSFAFSQKNKFLLCRFLIVCYQQPLYVIAIGNIMLDGRMTET